MNVHVITADAQNVQLEGRFDAMLMFGAPDIYASPKTLANLVPYLRNGARFVAFGANRTSEIDSKRLDVR
jgi:hypothetical protein